ncbi:MAG: hypothetical protein IJV35_04700 [Neisseriaceae bacterium]|nr:hypothetical protein [Neisseriaceae bacterium]
MGVIAHAFLFKLSGCLKTFLHCRCIDLRHPKIIFNFISLVKNNFRRLPRRAYGTARNDEQWQPENPNSKTLYLTSTTKIK